MKRMKRILAGLLVAGMMLALVGCGGEEKTVTLRADLSAELSAVLEEPVTASDTMILTAKGDTIQQLREVMEIDFANVDDEWRDIYIEAYDEQLASMVQEASGIDGVTSSNKISGTVCTFEFTIDCTNSSAVKAAAEKGLLEIDEGLINKLSLKATQEGLAASGYEVVE